MLVYDLISFSISCLVLIISGIYLVKSLGKISRFLGISEFSASFIIMAFATSIPELFIGVQAAMSGNPSLSLGNIIGANIIDLTLVAGIIVISTKEIKFKSKRVGGDTNLMLFAILLVIILYVIGNQLSQIDGVILLCFFCLHTYTMLKKRKKYKGKLTDGERASKKFAWLLIFLLALIGLFISSSFVVRGATNLAIDLQLPNILIGLFLVSIATTLPELVFGLSATQLKHKVMAIGDQIGTVIANSTLILGIVAIIHPITVEFMPFLISSIFMFTSAFIFVTFLKTGNRIERMEGISLILIYVLFIIIEFFAK